MLIFILVIIAIIAFYFIKTEVSLADEVVDRAIAELDWLKNHINWTPELIDEFNKKFYE